MNPKKHIPHPEAERGRANALLLFMLAFTAASFTLVAGTNPGSKNDYKKSDRQCTFGSAVTKTNSLGKIQCERPYLSMQICKDCEPGDPKDICSCEQTCVPNGSVQQGRYEKRTTTQTKDVKAGTKLDAAWKFLSINGDGTWKYEMKIEGEWQCYFDKK